MNSLEWLVVLALGDHCFQPLSLDESNADIDSGFHQAANTLYHALGSADMGSVIDTDLKVYGMNSLRVIDEGVLFVLICAHYQVPIYVLIKQVLVTEIIKKAK